MDRNTFLTVLNNRGVPKNEWLNSMEEYRKTSGYFSDDPEVLSQRKDFKFKPENILNYDPRENMDQKELDLYNQFSTEEDEFRYISHQFVKNKYKEEYSPEIIDYMIRNELKLGDDDKIDYSSYVTKKRLQYNELSRMGVSSDEWMISPQERFQQRNPEQDTVIKNPTNTAIQGFYDKQIKPRWEIANSLLATFYQDSPVKTVMGIENFEKKIKNKEVGRRFLNGEMIRGSASVQDAAQHGYMKVNYQQEYNALWNAGRFEEADRLKAKQDEYDKELAGAFDYSDKHWTEKAVKMTASMVTPMAENLFVGGLTRDRKKLARVINLSYWANQGGGQVKADIVGDRKLTEINENERNEINMISNILSIPYAATEFAFAAFPSKSALGSTVLRDLMRRAAVFAYKAGGKKLIGGRVVATGIINNYVERLEEGIQEFINTTAVELGQKADPEMETVTDTFKEYLKSDWKNAVKRGKEAFEESKYAVMFISAGGSVVDLVQSNREYKSIQQEKENLIKRQGLSEEEALDLSIAKHGILGKGKQKEAMVQVKSQQLVAKGVEEKKAKEIAEALVNARNKKQTKEALFEFNKVILTSYAKETRDRINSTLSDDLLTDFDVETLARMLSEAELETESNTLAEELSDEAQALIDNGLKNLRIKLATETLAQVMDRSQARTYAEQLEELDGKQNEDLRRKISMELSDIAADFQVPNMPYSRLGLLTEDDFTQLRENYTEEELSRLFFGDVPLYQFPKNQERLFEIFKLAVRGDKDAQARYNKSMQDARDIDYDRFLKAFNLVDARFQPSEFVNEQSEIDSQPFTLTEEQRQQILAGELAVKEVEEVANIRGISIEEARILVVDLMEKYGTEIDLSTETETNEQKDFRIDSIKNISINVTQALSEVAPDVKIITHDTSEEFTKATGQTGADGVFIGDVDGSRIIHIDNTIARPETVAHEAFHALVNSLDISNIDSRLFEIAERVKPYLEKSALEELDLHLNNYKNVEYKGEESLAKMVEILSRNYQALPQTEKNIIVKFIESIIDMLGLSDYADAIFNIGFKTRKGIPKRDKQVINFLNTLSVSLSEGITIQQESLDVLRPDIETLNKKDLVARAKELGVPSYGTKAQILERVRGKFGKRQLRASRTLSDKIADANVTQIYEDLENLSYTELQQLGRVLKEYDRQRLETHNETYFKNRPEYNELYPDPVAPPSLNLVKEDLFESIDLAFKQLRDNDIPNLLLDMDFYEDIRGFFPPSRYDTESQVINPKAIVRKKIFRKEDFKRLEVNPNTTLTENVNPATLDRKIVTTIMADRLAGGAYGEEKFFGGIYYPTITGYAWAASTEDAAQKIVDQLKLQKNEDGFYYLTPIIMGEDAHLSNNSVLRAVVSHFETAIEKGELTLEKFQKEAINAFNKESVKDLLPAVKEAIQQETVEEAVFQISLIVRELSFSKRKDFITTILGMGRNVKYPSIGDHPYFAKLLSDPDLQKVARGEIVNVIKLSALPTVVKTDPNSEYYHDAYGYHLEMPQGETLEVMMLEDTLDATQVIPEFEGTDEDGKPVKYNAEEYFDRQINKLGKTLLSYKASQVQKKLIESSFAAELRIVDPIKLPEFQKTEYARKPEIIQAALQLVRGEITPDEYAELVMRIDPFEPYEKLPDRIDTGIIKSAMRQAGQKKSLIDKIGLNNANITGVGDVEIKDGDQVSARLDIRTYNRTGIFAVTLHEGKLGASQTGRVMSYVPSIRLKDPVFKSQSHFTAYEIATGTKKMPISRIEGFYQKYTDEKNYDRAKEVLDIMQGKKKSKQKWIQVGFNPFRFGYFWDRESGQPVLSGSEAIQIGNVVFVKDPVYGDRSDPEFSIAKTPKEVEKALAAGIPEPEKVRFSKREPIPEDVADIIKGLVGFIKEQPLIDEQALDERTSQLSITREDINKTREAYFIEGEAQKEVQHFESVIKRVQDSYTSDGADQLIRTNIANLQTLKKVNLNPDFVFTLALRKDQLEREIQQLSRQVEEAKNNGSITTEQNLLNQVNEKVALLEDLLTVSQRMTSDFARGLRFAQLTQTKLNLYSLPRVIQSARKAKGEELTKEERNELTRLTKEISDLDDIINNNNQEISKVEEEDLRKSSEDFINTTNKEFVKKTKREKVKIIKERNEILKRIRQMGFVINEGAIIRLSKVDQPEFTAELRREVAKLARTFVEEGVTDLNSLISKIRTTLPDYSEYDIMNILSNRTPKKIKETNNSTRNILIELKKQARLRAEIKDLLDGVISEKREIKPDTDIVKKLKTQLKELRQQILNSDDIKADAIYDRIRRIEEGIEEAVSPRSNKKEASARLQQARKDLRELQRISKIDDQIKELQAQLQLSPKELEKLANAKLKKEEKPIRNRELENKIKERAALQSELRDKIYNLQQKGFKHWYREIAGIPRALLATADMSYLLRQGLIVSAGHPILAAKAFGKAFQAFFSKGNARLFDNNLRNMDIHPTRLYYGLELSTMEGALTEREETFATTLLQKVAGINIIISASERHMVTGLNHLRTGLFDDFINKHPEASEDAKRAYARYVNVATGRGELGDLEGSAQVLSNLFFSPRFAVSRVQAPAYAISNLIKQPELRAEMMRQWLAVAGTAFTVLALAKANGAEVGDDPEDSDWGKFVIGNRRYDIFGGMVQPLRIIALALKTSDAAYLKLFTDEEVDKGVGNEFAKFVEYKFNPILSIAHKLAFKEDPFTHQEIDWSEDWKEQAWSFAPIVAQTLKDAIEEEYTLTETSSVFIPEFLGVGVGVYEKRNTKKRKNAPRFY